MLSSFCLPFCTPSLQIHGWPWHLDYSSILTDEKWNKKVSESLFFCVYETLASRSIFQKNNGRGQRLSFSTVSVTKHYFISVYKLIAAFHVDNCQQKTLTIALQPPANKPEYWFWSSYLSTDHLSASIFRLITYLQAYLEMSTYFNYIIILIKYFWKIIYSLY